MEDKYSMKRYHHLDRPRCMVQSPQEMKIHRGTLHKTKLAKMDTSKKENQKKRKSLGLNSRVIPGLSMLLFIS